jgi:PTS system fructose-specific IIC component
MASNGRAKSVQPSARTAEDRPLAELINGSIRCVESADSTEEVLRTLAGLAHAKYPPLSADRLLDALQKREELFSTAIPGGIAFPHPRRPLEGIGEPVLALLNVRKGVEFGAADGKPSHTFVLVCSPDDAAHLRLLARLTALFRSDSAVQALEHCASPQEVISLLGRLEEHIGSPREVSS